MNTESAEKQYSSLIQEFNQYLERYTLLSAVTGTLITLYVYGNELNPLFYLAALPFYYALYNAKVDEPMERKRKIINEKEARQYARDHLEDEINTGEFDYDRTDFADLTVKSYDGEARLETDADGNIQYFEVPMEISPLSELHVVKVWPFKEPEHRRGYILGSYKSDMGYSAEQVGGRDFFNFT